MKKRIVIITAALILLISAGGYWWTKVRFVESTNNAYVEADISHVSVKVPGYVLQSLVDDNQHVEKGQLLAVLDSRQLETKLAQADAALASAQANRQTLSAKVELQQALIKQAQAAVAASRAEQTVAQQHLSRAQKLKLSNYSSQENVDQLLANFNSANAHLDEANALVVAKQTELSVLKAQSAEAQAEVSLAQAELAYAQLQLQDTQVTAPFAGVIGKRGAQVGQYVQPGQALFSIVPDGKVWITANFKETQVQYLRVGQTVKIQLDAFPGSEYLGEIDSFSPASGAKFSLLPAENATGNFTKVVQRVPVRIRLLKGTERDPQEMPIIPGLSALIDVNTEQAVMLAKQQAKQRSEHLSLALKSANQSTQ